MTADTKQILILIGTLAAFVLAFLLFRDGLGIFIFLVAGIVFLVQLIRVGIGMSSSKTLKTLWDFLKDAFWGMG